MAYNKLLLVDDEPFNLDILEKRLTKEGYTVDTACDGTEAWEMIQAGPEEYETILLDRMMPDMDGIEVLKKLKAVPQLAAVPVIMQTAKASGSEVQEGLEAGAYYYLTKPYEKKSLLAIVKSAIDDYRRYNEMQRALDETSLSIGLMNQGEFEFRSIAEAKSLAALLANTAPQPARTIVGLTEMMLNAIEHGNLAISYEEKTHFLNEGTWFEEIERRRQLPEYINRVARLTFVRSEDQVEFEISDDGEGFDWESYLEADPSRVYDNHGRGIMMANNMSFDTIEYRGKGNQVVCRVALANNEQAERDAA